MLNVEHLIRRSCGPVNFRTGIKLNCHAIYILEISWTNQKLYHDIRVGFVENYFTYTSQSIGTPCESDYSSL